MRNSILELLRASGLEPVSGEKISEQLGVSRTAIWKHIQALKYYYAWYLPPLSLLTD